MWLNVILGLITLFIFIYLYMTRKYGFFKSQGIFELPPTFPLGSEPQWQFLKFKKHGLEIQQGFYRKYKVS